MASDRLPRKSKDSLAHGYTSFGEARQRARFGQHTAGQTTKLFRAELFSAGGRRREICACSSGFSNEENMPPWVP